MKEKIKVSRKEDKITGNKYTKLIVIILSIILVTLVICIFAYARQKNGTSETNIVSTGMDSNADNSPVITDDEYGEKNPIIQTSSEGRWFLVTDDGYKYWEWDVTGEPNFICSKDDTKKITSSGELSDTSIPQSNRVGSKYGSYGFIRLKCTGNIIIRDSKKWAIDTPGYLGGPNISPKTTDSYTDSSGNAMVEAKYEISAFVFADGRAGLFGDGYKIEYVGTKDGHKIHGCEDCKGSQILESYKFVPALTLDNETSKFVKQWRKTIISSGEKYASSMSEKDLDDLASYSGAYVIHATYSN